MRYETVPGAAGSVHTLTSPWLMRVAPADMAVAAPPSGLLFEEMTSLPMALFGADGTMHPNSPASSGPKPSTASSNVTCSDTKGVALGCGSVAAASSDTRRWLCGRVASQWEPTPPPGAPAAPPFNSPSASLEACTVTVSRRPRQLAASGSTEGRAPPNTSERNTRSGSDELSRWPSCRPPNSCIASSPRDPLKHMASRPDSTAARTGGRTNQPSAAR